MALTLGPPPLFFKGRFFPSEELTAVAAAWTECIRERLPRSRDSVAMALAYYPQAIWLQPRILLVTAEIPRLPSGKVDRQTCVTILAKASGAAGA